MKYIVSIFTLCLVASSIHAGDKPKFSEKSEEKKKTPKAIACVFSVMTNAAEDELIVDDQAKRFTPRHKKPLALTPRSTDYMAWFASSPTNGTLQVPTFAPSPASKTKASKKKKSSRAEKERKHKVSDEKDHKASESDSPTSSDNEPDQKPEVAPIVAAAIK